MAFNRDENIIKSLEDISYTGELLDKTALSKALEDGQKSVEYTETVSFLTNELRSLCSIDEQVNKISLPEDSISFLMELSSFLKELGCPYDNLTQGHMSDRLVDIDDRRLLLEYLISELMATRIIQEGKPDRKIELKLQETPNAANMKRILSTLCFPKPPANLSVQALFSKLAPIVETNIKKGGNDLIGNPIFNLKLTDKQWHILQQVQQDLHSEYTIRRDMLLKRLDCTIQSFQWSDRMRGKEELLTKTYTEKRKLLRVEPDVNLSDLISARDDLAIIEKTSSAYVRRNTRSSINRVIIGQVPDRGGRTDELAPPPPEMPSWKQHSAVSNGGSSGRDYSEDKKSQKDKENEEKKFKESLKSQEEKEKDIKSLIEKIPTEKNTVFAYQLDWSAVDNNLMVKNMRPWINKKIIEYIGEPDPTLVDFICSKVLAGSQPQIILEDVQMVLNEEAEVFVVKMWRLLIYEVETKKLGLVK